MGVLGGDRSKAVAVVSGGKKSAAFHPPHHTVRSCFTFPPFMARTPGRGCTHSRGRVQRGEGSFPFGEEAKSYFGGFVNKKNYS